MTHSAWLTDHDCVVFCFSRLIIHEQSLAGVVSLGPFLSNAYLFVSHGEFHIVYVLS